MELLSPGMACTFAPVTITAGWMHSFPKAFCTLLVQQELNLRSIDLGSNALTAWLQQGWSVLLPFEISNQHLKEISQKLDSILTSTKL